MRLAKESDAAVVVEQFPIDVQVGSTSDGQTELKGTRRIDGELSDELDHPVDAESRRKEVVQFDSSVVEYVASYFGGGLSGDGILVVEDAEPAFQAFGRGELILESRKEFVRCDVRIWVSDPKINGAKNGRKEKKIWESHHNIQPRTQR